MPLPAQFQLGLELTNIVNPLSQAIGALGSLALVSAIQKAGSDVITEIKLASLIGRHRIDEVIKFHFRAMVAKADQTVISKYIDILLESGSGPTVQEAMKNSAHFSMLIQLSALAFAHEDESLANAMVERRCRLIFLDLSVAIRLTLMTIEPLVYPLLRMLPDEHPRRGSCHTFPIYVYCEDVSTEPSK